MRLLELFVAATAGYSVIYWAFATFWLVPFMERRRRSLSDPLVGEDQSSVRASAGGRRVE